MGAISWFGSNDATCFIRECCRVSSGMKKAAAVCMFNSMLRVVVCTSAVSAPHHVSAAVLPLRLLLLSAGVLKALSFMFEYIGEMGKDYIYAVTPLLQVRRQGSGQGRVLWLDCRLLQWWQSCQGCSLRLS